MVAAGLLCVFFVAECLAAENAAAAGVGLPTFTAEYYVPRLQRIQSRDRLAGQPSIFQGMMIPGLSRERGCRSPDEIHNRLKRQGWWDFDTLERSGEHFTVRARRPNGTAYKLTIDGCSGRLLGAMRLNGGQRGYRLWPR
jgi:hypothetical protein